jgi:hypothetical protein
MVSVKDKLKQDANDELFTQSPFDHPGFPRIQAIATLKGLTSIEVKKEIDMAMDQIEFMANTYEGVSGAALRTQANDIMRGHKTETVGFSAYFNTSEMRTAIEEINKAIRKKMQFAMDQGSRQGAAQASAEIRRMSRRFKSNILSGTAVEGDIYHTIADSIKSIDVGERNKNQFITMRVGSYDIGDSESNPTGIRGSRMRKSDSSLVELTEEGTGRFRLRSGFISVGTERIKRKLKGDSIAGVTRS